MRSYFSHVQHCVILWTVACQAPLLAVGLSSWRQEDIRVDGYQIRKHGGKKDGKEIKQEGSSRSMDNFFSFYISVFSKFSIISIWLLSPYKNVKEEGGKGKKTGCSDSDLLLQVEAGKGLEMRKLVLSGFLASEEIYINQLEALLLVSMYFRVFVL